MTAEHVAIAVLVFAAAFTQGSIGFGFGLVVMAALPTMLPLQVAVPFTAVYGACVAAIIFWRYRRHASAREMLPMLIGSVAGLPLGILALRDLDPEPCIRALGVFLIAFVLQAAWPRRTAAPEREAVARRWGVPAGFAAGLFSGAFAMGGPPVIAYATARRFSPATFKGVLQGYFMITTAILVGMLAYAGLLTSTVLEHNLHFAPMVPLGIWIGTRYGDRIPPVLFRRFVLGALLLLGLKYVVGL
ncbi:MAG: sulfite exporter TauE/SafE family protein [Planctomycetota bacterium]|nr:sulfite exporter TauE/SafE family protein [Planctomycetota bacterium]